MFQRFSREGLQNEMLIGIFKVTCLGRDLLTSQHSKGLYTFTTLKFISQKKLWATVEQGVFLRAQFCLQAVQQLVKPQLQQYRWQRIKVLQILCATDSCLIFTLLTIFEQ